MAGDVTTWGVGIAVAISCNILLMVVLRLSSAQRGQPQRDLQNSIPSKSNVTA